MKSSVARFGVYIYTNIMLSLFCYGLMGDTMQKPGNHFNRLQINERRKNANGGTFKVANRAIKILTQ